MTDIYDLNKVTLTALDEIERHRSIFKMATDAVDQPLLDAVKAMESNSAIKQMLADIERQQTLVNSLEGPLAELRTAGVFDQASFWQREFKKTQQLMSEYSDRFTMPDVGPLTRLAQGIHDSHITQLAEQCVEHTSQIQKAMEAMQTPWLDAERAIESVKSFAELQGIGSVLERIPTFDEQVNVALREALGDWRDPISWPKSIITDLGARSEFYIDLGFDSNLTHFPAPAFQESVEIAGLRHEPAPVVLEYGAPVPQLEHNEEALTRTNVAHDWIQRLETNLRQFIDVQMTRAYGLGWPRHRLPKGMYETWMEKKQAAEAAGRESWPLIAYADFTDYERVICKRDNWKEVFSGYFTRPESVRESFQRLHMIRLDTMHARPIGQDDELLLYVEVKRLVRVIVH